MARRDRRTRTRGHAGRRRLIISVALAVVAVTGVGVGYFAYRAAADLPGVAVPDQGNNEVVGRIEVMVMTGHRQRVIRERGGPVDQPDELALTRFAAREEPLPGFVDPLLGMLERRFVGELRA